MTPVIVACIVGAALLGACGLALWDQARCQHDDTCEHAPLTDESYADALAVNSPDGSEITADDIAWLWSVGADMGDSQ